MKEILEGLRQELSEELQQNILSWWQEFMPDQKLGGFHGHVDHQNQVVADAPKGSILNARILWTFSAAYLQTRNADHLQLARRAYDYILDYFIDYEKGGVYWELNADGSVKAGRKQIYALGFTIYGLSEFYRASGEHKALELAIGLFHDIEKRALDRERNGYTEALDRDWRPVKDLRLSEKDENESKTMNTHLHILEAYGNLYRVWKDPVLEAALENLIRIFLEHFVDPESKRLNLFFDDDWKLRSDMISYGHDIECSWLLHEAAVILGDDDLIRQCGKVALEMAEVNFEGVDRDGGLMYEFFPSTGELDGDKHWWPQAEAMVGYFNAWQLSGKLNEPAAAKDVPAGLVQQADPRFLDQVLQSWEFIKEKLIDTELGEWIWSVNRDGEPRTEKEKGGFWKCPYHNGRACLELIRRIDEMQTG